MGIAEMNMWEDPKEYNSKSRYLWKVEVADFEDRIGETLLPWFRHVQGQLADACIRKLENQDRVDF